MINKKLYLGDCNTILETIEANTVDLIYLDPPFYTQKTQTLKSRNNLKEYTFDDKWDDIQKYTNYIKERLIKCHKVLKSTGSIFLHCDRKASHYLRVALDEVFGYENFQSEIIWSYKRWSNAKKGLLNSHQVIYFYSKTSDFKFNPVYTDYSPTTNIDQIFQDRVRDKNGKSKYRLDEKGEVVLGKSKKGVPLSDVWEIPYLNPKAQERTGYPTQKPLLLLERIVNLVTDKDDTVLDPFCGSGTTLVASKLLERNYIGIDMSKDAIELTKERLKNPIKTESALLKNGLNSYLNQDEGISEFLKTLSVVGVQRNSGIDGFLQINGIISPIPVKVQRKSESMLKAYNTLLKACEKNSYKQRVLIKTHNANSSMFEFDESLLNINNVLVIDISNEQSSNPS